MTQNAGNTRPLRLAITTYTLSAGGVSRFIIELAGYFRNCGNEVTVICTDRKGNWFHRILEEGLSVKTFHSALYEWIPFGRIMLSARIGRYMKSEAFGVVINNHSFYIHASAGYFISRTRIVHVVHNQRAQMVKMEADPMSDMVVGVSPGIEIQAKKFLPPEKVTSIPNGIRIPEFPSGGPAPCSERAMDLLYIGRIDHWQKGVLIFPQIIKSILEKGVEVKLTVVGDGPDLQRLKKTAEAMGVTRHIFFAGHVAPGEVGKYYLEHKIFLLPSRFEGHPLTLMEAMAHGCVPVASLLSFSTDICVDPGDSGFLVDPGDVGGFADRILQLLEDPELLNQLGMNAFRKARLHFSVDGTHRKYLELIQGLNLKNDQDRNPRRFNRKYISWREIVPFRLIMAWKKNITRKKQDGTGN